MTMMQQMTKHETANRTMIVKLNSNSTEVLFQLRGSVILSYAIIVHRIRKNVNSRSINFSLRQSSRLQDSIYSHSYYVKKCIVASRRREEGTGTASGRTLSACSRRRAGKTGLRVVPRVRKTNVF
jgi:hypothetical protein